SPAGLRSSALMVAAGPAMSLVLAIVFMVLANGLRESAPVPAFISFAVRSEPGRAAVVGADGRGRAGDEPGAGDRVHGAGEWAARERAGAGLHLLRGPI